MDYRSRWMSFFDDFAASLKKDLPASSKDEGERVFLAQPQENRRKILLVARTKMRCAILFYSAANFSETMDANPQTTLPETQYIFDDLLSRMRQELSASIPPVLIQSSAEVLVQWKMHSVQYLAERKQDDCFLRDL